MMIWVVGKGRIQPEIGGAMYGRRGGHAAAWCARGERSDRHKRNAEKEDQGQHAEEESAMLPELRQE
jgi:hypothetical protein